MFEIAEITGYSLLLLRIIIAIIFFSSGKNHMQNPKERGKSIGISTNATRVLGAVEIVGAILISLGYFTQIGALLLMITMLGAIYKKIFKWNTKFYEVKGYGWHYDLLLLIGLFVIFTTNGGHLILENIL